MMQMFIFLVKALDFKLNHIDCEEINVSYVYTRVNFLLRLTAIHVRNKSYKRNICFIGNVYF